MDVKVLRSSSSSNCTIIDGVLMIDCGLQPTEVIKITRSLPKAILVTHEHGDHTKHLHKWLNLVPVYTTAGTWFAMYQDYKHKNMNIIEENKTYNIEGYKVDVYQSKHESAEDPVYFVINDKLLFSVDNKEVDTEKLGKIPFEEVCIESNYSEKLLKEAEDYDRAVKNLTHSSFENAVSILEKLDLSECKRINLLHVSKDFGEPDRYKEETEMIFGIETMIGGAK